MVDRKKWIVVAPFLVVGASVVNATYFGVLVASGDLGPNGGHIFALVLHLLIAVPGSIYLVVSGVKRMRLRNSDMNLSVGVDAPSSTQVSETKDAPR